MIIDMLFLLFTLFILVMYKQIKKSKNGQFFIVAMTMMAMYELIYFYRKWYLYSVYLIVLLVLVTYLGHLFAKKDFKLISKKPMTILMCVVIVVTGILAYVLPVNTMPDDYIKGKIGTISFDLVDENRSELYGDQIGSPRKIRLQMWYPITHSKTLDKAPWLYDGMTVAEGLPGFVGLPGFIMAQTTHVQSNSYEGGLVVEQEGGYPVIIISHGWTGFRNLHTDLGEMLASNGYIAISIDHTYGSMGLVYDDGEEAKVDPEALPSGLENEVFLDYANDLVHTYAEDTRLVIDYLDQINDKTTERGILGQFAGQINIDKIGLIGHSTGGGGVTEIALTDERVDALFAMDPWIEPIDESLINLGLKVPTLYLNSEQWKDRPNNKTLSLIETATDKELLKMYRIDGVNHQDFTMMYMFAPVTNIIGYQGEMDPAQGAILQQDYVLGFFDQWIMGKDVSIDDIEAAEEAVHVLTFMD